MTYIETVLSQGLHDSDLHAFASALHNALRSRRYGVTVNDIARYSAACPGTVQNLVRRVPLAATLDKTRLVRIAQALILLEKERDLPRA
jgi:hypothetical protein